ncbi:MAG: murein hydrolase activator EnvC family protein, partial [Methyloceanibacter sp.]
ARITAPADGWVVYAGPFRSYGQLLIINAGGGYHILLAGMSRIDVSLGQFVLAGEPVAVMGAVAPTSQGGKDTSRPVLYVEFRKDGRPIDPDPWWAVASEKVQG